MGIRIVLVSHGEQAKGMMNTLHMVLGPQENMAVHCLMAEESADTLYERLKQELEGAGAGYVLFITDLLYGTPFNTVNRLAKDYDVHACTNGREALTETYRVKPSLVISDVMMPELDGNALCSQLKTNNTTNYIPVILLTARNRDEDRLEGLETGADAYIVKPFNMDILRRTILNLLNSRRLLKMKYERTDDLEERVEDIRLKSPDDKLLEKIMECIRKNLTNSDLNIDMISDEVGISRVHLHRKMKELTGQTPHDFIRSIRLKKAAQLLAEKGMNVTEVMYACGFANSASFSTIFRKYYGMSPRDYMKEHQER